MPTSNRSKAFLDTTILTDILVGSSVRADRAKLALKRFESTQLPVYAIKEFKAGPLANFVWIHNKFVLDSLEGAIEALHRLSMTPQRYKTATAIEAIQASIASEDKTVLGALSEKYGKKAGLNEVVRDRWRLSLKTAVFKAWRKRRTVAGETVQPLQCYAEVAPFERRGLLELKPTTCKPLPECCLADLLKAQPDHLRALKDATDAQPSRGEIARRSKALRSLIRTPKRTMTAGVCRSLGDAIFAFFCPNDAVILTTNLRDHAPLAGALGKVAERPKAGDE